MPSLGTRPKTPPLEEDAASASDDDANVDKPDGKKTKKQRKKFGKKHPPNEASLRIVDALMARPPNSEVSFDIHPNANPPSRADGLLRRVSFRITWLLRALQ